MESLLLKLLCILGETPRSNSIGKGVVYKFGLKSERPAAKKLADRKAASIRCACAFTGIEARPLKRIPEPLERKQTHPSPEKLNFRLTVLIGVVAHC